MRKLNLKYLLTLAIVLFAFSAANAQLEQGVNAVKRGDYITGVNTLKAVVTKDKGFDANYYYGKALLETGSLNDAEKHFKIALQDDDEGVLALVGLGDIANRKKQYAAANQFYRNAFKIDNENVSVLLAQGKNLSQAGNLDSAIIVLTRATSINNKIPEVYSVLGDAYFYGRAFPAAIQNYNKSISIKNNAAAHFGLGRVNYYMKNYQEALDEYKLAVQLDPNLADAYFESGRLLLYNGSYVASGEAFNKYTALVPGSQLGKIYYSRVLIAQEKYQDALTSLDEALAIDPTNTSAFKYKAYAYRGLNDNTKAVEFFEKVPAADLEAEDYVVLASVYNASGDKTRAYDTFNKAIGMDSLESNTYYELGKAQFNNDEFEPAIASFDRAITMGSTQLAAHVYKGIAFYQMKNYDAAISAFDQAITLDPTFAFSYLWKGRALLAQNKKDEAIVAYNKVLEIDPNNEDAKNDLKLIQGSGQ